MDSPTGLQPHHPRPPALMPEKPWVLAALVLLVDKGERAGPGVSPRRQEA